ncbi:hypothetical protein [Pseudomonas sp. LTJR-52]|uniref:hypothetical protein n=1 Tax=Pseudomonas sp. LTJR-52 TaxID=2479392 RepID=UPI0013CF26D5|nr:hypothetical protein [Pseudomonas sp. LTJR-52]
MEFAIAHVDKLQLLCIIEDISTDFMLSLSTLEEGRWKVFAATSARQRSQALS